MKPEYSHTVHYHSPSLPASPPPLPTTPPPLPAAPLPPDAERTRQGWGPIQDMEDLNAANWMTRASATVLVLLVLGSAYTLLTVSSGSSNENSDVTEPLAFQESWPSVFDAARSPMLFEPAAPKLMSEALFEDLAFTIGFVSSQEIRSDKIISKYDRIGARLVDAQARFHVRFDPALENINGIVGNEVSSWNDSKQEASERIYDALHGIGFTRKSALDFAATVDKRALGDLPSPVLETLLMFHPKYMRRPELQFTDGYVREYRTDGAGKARGIKIGIQYPASWKAKEGRRPHIVQQIISENGHGLESALILIKEIPAPISGSDILELRGTDIWKSAFPNTKVLETGKVRIARLPAIWGEFEAMVNRTGIELDLHVLSFIMVRNNHMVQITFSVAQPTDESSDVATRFKHYAGLFRVMINSIDFFGRYD